MLNGAAPIIVSASEGYSRRRRGQFQEELHLGRSTSGNSGDDLSRSAANLRTWGCEPRFLSCNWRFSATMPTAYETAPEGPERALWQGGLALDLGRHMRVSITSISERANICQRCARQIVNNLLKKNGRLLVFRIGAHSFGLRRLCCTNA